MYRMAPRGCWLQIHGVPIEKKGFTLSEQQVISKLRVENHGEVLTGKREVNAMLDLVKQETERIDSRFLEPACGTGNFLSEILERKLRIVERRYGKSWSECERYAILSVCSIYGIDILENNVRECRKCLFAVFERGYRNLFREECLTTVKYILDRNIIWGDALTLNTVGNNPRPIVFCEWSAVNGNMIKRRDFEFHELLSYAAGRRLPLFSDLGEKAFFPEPVKEYPLTHYLRLPDVDEQQLQPGRAGVSGEPQQRRSVHTAPAGQSDTGYSANGNLERSKSSIP
jgi:hypothetical protein